MTTSHGGPQSSTQGTRVKDENSQSYCVSTQSGKQNSKLLLPTCKPEDKFGKQINKLDNFPPGQADLDDGDSGLAFEKVRAHQALMQDLGEDPDEDF